MDKQPSAENKDDEESSKDDDDYNTDEEEIQNEDELIYEENAGQHFKCINFSDNSIEIIGRGKKMGRYLTYFICF